MKRSHKIVLLAALVAFFLGTASVVTVGIFFWRLGEGQRLSRLGYEKMLQKDYDEAIKNLTDASNKIIIGDNRFWLYLNRGTAEFHKKRYDDAIRDFTTATEINSSKADPYEWRGQVYEEKKDLDRAAADYGRTVERDPNRGLAHFRRGQIEFKRRQFTEAQADFGETVRIWPDYAAGLVMLGRSYFDQNDIEHALASLDAAIDADPRSFHAHEMRALVYRKRGDGERAFFDEAAAQHLIRLQMKRVRPTPTPAPAVPNFFGPNGTLAHSPLASHDPASQIAASVEFRRLLRDAAASVHAGQREKAIELYNRALNLEVGPSDASFAVMERGTAYWEMGEYEKAGTDYEDAVRLNPGNPHAFVDRGIARDSNGDIDKALDDFAEAIRLDPNEYFAYTNRGDAFFHKNDFSDALTDYAKSIELDMTRPNAHIDRARVYIQQKELAKAIVECSTAIEWHPDAIRAYFVRSEAYVRSGRSDLAEQDLKTMEGTKSDGSLTTLLAASWFRATAPDSRMRNGKRALQDAKSAGEMSHWKRWYCFDHLAAAEAEVGDFPQAVNHAKQALELKVPPVYRSQMEDRLKLYQKRIPYRQPVEAR